MDTKDALALFRNAKGPARKLDDALAEVIGWSRRFTIVSDPKTGKPKRVQKSVWLVPGGDVERRVPEYSRDAQAAYEVLALLANGIPFAFVQKGGEASAQLWDEQICKAPTVAMAMCMAALNHLEATS